MTFQPIPRLYCHHPQMPGLNDQVLFFCLLSFKLKPKIHGYSLIATLEEFATLNKFFVSNREKIGFIEEKKISVIISISKEMQVVIKCVRHIMQATKNWNLKSSKGILMNDTITNDLYRYLKTHMNNL